MLIDRNALIERLHTFALADHGVITGAPGVGKTVVVSQLADRLLNEGRGALLVGVSDLGDATEESIRAVLPHSGELTDTLSAYFTSHESPGVIIIDGFDAARDPIMRQRVLGLVRRLILSARGEWHVLVTVRLYDAEKSPDLLSLFPPGANRGSRARYVEVPRLEPEEVTAVADQLPGLAELYERATDELRELLRLPFHLWLIEQIVGALESPARADALALLSSVETEVQLLDRFWEARVTGGLNGLALATLAGRAVRMMVQARSLAIPTPQIWTAESQREWDELLSAEIFALSGPGHSRVGYQHNILFDYAASLYALSDDSEQMQAFLLEEPSRALFLRPSLVFHFAHLWRQNRSGYWRLFRSLATAEQLPIRLVARLIPPYVLASEARTISELAPIHEAPWHDADRVLLWVLQAVRFSSGARPELWAEFISALAPEASPSYAWEAAVLMNVLLARTAGGDQPGVTPAAHAFVRSHAGLAARRFLTRALSQREPTEVDRDLWWDVFGSNQALPFVLDTFDTDPAASAEVVKPVLGLIRRPEMPIRYFTALAHGINAIVRNAPDLAADVYRAVYRHVEHSEAPTALGGAVLRLRSTRRQDYEIVQYGLAKEYPTFLRTAPRQAIQAGVESGCMDLLRERVVRYLDPNELESKLESRTRTTRFRQTEIEWIEDHSAIWGSNLREDGARLIREAAEFISKAAEAGDESLPQYLIDFTGSAMVGYAWARLLFAGAEVAHALAQPLRELVLQRSVQTSLDLREALGAFVSAAAQYWTEEQLAEIEQSILSLADDDAVELAREGRERLRDQLLGAIPEEALVTHQARQRIAELKAAGEVPRIGRLVDFQVHSAPYHHDEWLREQGIDPERVENRALRTLMEPLDAFRDAWRNDKPTQEAVREVEPDLARAVEAVEHADGVDAVIRRDAWISIAGTAAAIARTVADDDELWNRVLKILLRAWEEPSDDVDEDADEKFTWPAWSPSPHTEAVQGLGSLLWKRADPKVVSKIQEILSTARDPSLRFLAMRFVLGLYNHDADSYWQLVQEVADRETNAVVLTELLSGVGQLTWKSPDAVRGVVQVVWPRWSGTDHKDLLEALAPVLVILVAHAKDAWAEAVLDECRQDPLSHENLLNRVHFEAVVALVPEPSSRLSEDFLSRLVDMLVRGVGALARADAVLRERQDHGELLADERGRVHQMVDTVISRIDLNLRVTPSRGERAATEFMREQSVMHGRRITSYYDRVWPIIEAVLAFAEEGQMLLAPTAHHMIELFNLLLKVNPTAVLEAANRAVQSSRRDNYNLDSLAIREVVHLAETVLADHRDILLSGSPMQAMLELLETFAEAGWTEALHLIWRLEEVFR